MSQRLNDCLGMGMGRSGKSLAGIPWEWELGTKLGMGMEWECKKSFPIMSTQDVNYYKCISALKCDDWLQQFELFS